MKAFIFLLRWRFGLSHAHLVRCQYRFRHVLSDWTQRTRINDQTIKNQTKRLSNILHAHPSFKQFHLRNITLSSHLPPFEPALTLCVLKHWTLTPPCQAKIMWYQDHRKICVHNVRVPSMVNVRTHWQAPCLSTTHAIGMGLLYYLIQLSGRGSELHHTD